MEQKYNLLDDYELGLTEDNTNYIKSKILWLDKKVQNKALNHKEISKDLSKLYDDVQNRQWEVVEKYKSDYWKEKYHDQMYCDKYYPVMMSDEFKALSPEDKKKIFEIWDYTEVQEYEMLKNKIEHKDIIKKMLPYYRQENAILKGKATSKLPIENENRIMDKIEVALNNKNKLEKLVKSEYTVKDKVKYYSQRISDKRISEAQRNYASRRIKELAAM